MQTQKQVFQVQRQGKEFLQEILGSWLEMGNEFEGKSE